ncbi:MAG: DUF1145 domain-containing protein [Arsenophonus sp. NC-QC1-MAG3]
MILINIRKLLILFIWKFMIFNLIHPFLTPLKYFIDVVMIFMIFMQTIFISFFKKKASLLSYYQIGV